MAQAPNNMTSHACYVHTLLRSHAASFCATQELWRLDLSTWEWDHLPGKGGPSARSGHRMALYKGKVVMFGGYYDTGRDMRCVIVSVCVCVYFYTCVLCWCL